MNGRRCGTCIYWDYVEGEKPYEVGECFADPEPVLFRGSKARTILASGGMYCESWGDVAKPHN